MVSVREPCAKDRDMFRRFSALSVWEQTMLVKPVYLRAQLEADKITYVVEYSFAFLDGSQDGGEVIINQHHVWCFLTHISPRSTHGYSDISSAQSYCVIYAVTSHRYHVITLL